MSISYLMCVFSACAVLGWIAECIYVSSLHGGWVNRGFLFGPVCPIYGAGAILLYISFCAFGASVDTASITHIFLGSMLGASILEYVTSYVLELIFHARWWDYSHMPLNIKGRVCLPFALLFGLGGTLFYVFIAPLFFELYGLLPHALIEALSLIFAALFAADLSLTVAAQIGLTQKLELLTSDFDAVMTVALSDALQVANGVAQSATQTARSAEQALKSATGNLSAYQKHALSNIKSYTKPKTFAAAEKLKSAAGLAHKVRRFSWQKKKQ